MELYEILLAVICWFLLIILFQLGALVRASKVDSSASTKSLDKDLSKLHEQQADMLTELMGIRESCRELHQIQTELSAVRCVTDAIDKYQLPSQEQRDALEESEYLSKSK